MTIERIGRFEILEKIGQGGMGTVFKARDPQIGRIVAIKLLREGFDDDDLRGRFMQEARTAGGLQHPNIVTIFELGEHNGSPFIVMELVVGEPLDKLIKRQQPVPLVRKLELVEALCSGLDEAHEAGVIHRDIKPGNLIVKTNGVLKIVDFGIARAGDSTKTRVGSLVGTPNYMPPEQLSGVRVDRRADVFAVGAVFYELLAYRRAFPGSVAEAITRVLTREPEPLSQLCTGLDPQIEAIVSKALAKNPDQRYQDLGEMRRQLARIRERLQQDAPETIVHPPTAATVITPAPPSSSRDTPRSGSREESMRRALAEVDAARRQFAAGDVSSAIGRLEAFRPANELVEEALVTLRDRAADIQRQVDRDATNARRMETGAEAFKRGDFQLARESADAVLLVDERHTQALDLKQRAQNALDERQRLEELDRHAQTAIRQAFQLFESGQRRAAVDLLTQFQPPHPEVSARLAAFREEIAVAVQQAQENHRHADALVKRGLERLALGKVDDALAAATEAIRFESSHAGALELNENATRARDALHRRAEHDRHAQVLVRSCRAQFRAGQHRRAVDTLRAFAPPHQLVAEALAELTRELTEMEQREQGLRERSERDERERVLVAERAREEAERVARAEAQRREEATRRAREEAQALQHAREEDERRAHDARVAAMVRDQAATAPAPAKIQVRGTAPQEPQGLQESEPKGPWPWQSRSIGTRALLGAAGGIVMAFVAVGGYWLYTSRSPVPQIEITTTVPSPPPEVPVLPAPGTVVIDALPWAEIMSVVDTNGAAQQIAPNSYTPIALTLPSGEYEVTLRNGATRKTKVRVDASGPTTPAVIDFGGVDAVEYFRRQGWPP